MEVLPKEWRPYREASSSYPAANQLVSSCTKALSLAPAKIAATAGHSHTLFSATATADTVLGGGCRGCECRHRWCPTFLLLGRTPLCQRHWREGAKPVLPDVEQVCDILAVAAGARRGASGRGAHALAHHVWGAAAMGEAGATQRWGAAARLRRWGGGDRAQPGRRPKCSTARLAQ